MKLYDLKTKELKEVSDSKATSFLYNNLFGRILLKILTTKFIANLVRLYMNSILSIPRIKRFIKKNNINMDEYEDIKYKSFNEFFMRKIKPGKRKIKDTNFAICDAKLSAYKINEDTTFKIKDSIYTVNELIHEDAKNYKNGTALVYRLAVDDYHHYIFPDDGILESSKLIKGHLHTVQPIAFKRYKVFKENTRVVSTLNTKDHGIIKYIEVGAMIIGRIVNEDKETFKMGDEKGHFEFGGSTIVLLYEEGKVKVNKKIFENTNNNIETIVKMGSSIE